MAQGEPYIFTCGLCGYTGLSEWSQEEAVEETRELWDALDPGGTRVTVCDPCFEKFMAWMAREHQA
jgi:hypothetical protein